MLLGIEGIFRVGAKRATSSRSDGGRDAPPTLDSTPQSDNMPAGDPALPPQGPGVAELLESARKLVPGESLAGYMSLLAAGETVLQLPADATSYPAALAALAWAFLAITIFLRVVGTSDPKSTDFWKTVQWDVVGFSAAAFIALVLSSKGQFWPGERIGPSGQFLALVATSILGIVVPVVYAFKEARKAI